MLAADAHLCIDYGTATTTALMYTPDGRSFPIVVNGATVLPSGVWLDTATGRLLTGGPALEAARKRPEGWLAEPLRHIGDEAIEVAGVGLDPIEAVAAVLGGIATHAAALAGMPIGRVTLIVPCWWGPRRRQQLRLAATKTGLPEPHLVADAIAVATHWVAWSTAPISTGACALVINAGAGGITVSAIGVLDDGAQLLAHHTVPGSTATDLDTALAEHLITTTRGAGHDLWEQLTTPEHAAARHQLLEAVRIGKETLSRQTAQAAIALPAPHPPAILDRDILDTALAGVRQRLPEAVTHVLAAADMHREDLTAVLLTGGHAFLPGIADTAGSTAGHIPTMISRPDAATEGALRITGTSADPPSATAGPHVLPLQISSGWPTLIPPALLAVAAMIVLAQTLDNSAVSEFPGGGVAYFLRLPQLGISGFLIALACWNTGTAITGLQHTAARATSEQATLARSSRRALFTAAASGLALSTGFGIYSSSHMNFYTDTFAWWPILFALPIVILTTTAGLSITRIPAGNIPLWLRDYRTPTIPTLIATTGILITGEATRGIPDQYTLSPLESTSARLGMLILGAGIGLTIVYTPVSRLIAATTFGFSFAILFTWRTLNHYHWIFVTAIAWWTLVAMLHAIRSLSPALNERAQRLLQ
ncbi:Hsp70 family protein [Catenuloplanes sp. NPDC051500]|uniref:Hsp70 family protein n=1 Tax=Catenuloplanes sp. NPDC051500 TaxID=3363959 RepID=UPI00378C8AEE